jgi:NADPH2:quinone reductase
MKAAYIEKTGPPENIIFGDLPKPEPADSQVLVKIDAADVNPIDTYIRSGMVAAPLPKLYILGCDLAGVVEAVGPGAKRYRPGDRVWGSNQGLLGRQGTLAEYAAVDEQWLYPTPQGITSEAAVALSLVGITAHLGLVRDAKVKAGETLFVNGGTGGVGSAVVQIAKALGAKVITTAGSPERVKRCRELGADLAINYKTEDVDARIKQFAPQGVNVWWETLREPNFDRTVSLLAARGRMVLMAGRDARPPFPVGPFYVKGCSLYGFAMFNATAAEQRAAAEDINRWLVEGKLKANIDRVLPLSEAAAAHRLQEENTIGKAGTLAGKIVLKP